LLILAHNIAAGAILNDVSTLEADPEVGGRGIAVDVRPAGIVATRARIAQVGALSVRRLLPLRDRRTVGAWCFVDHYGPTSVDAGPGMHVPSHPHIGLQTVTWLFEGDVLHRDSLGSEQLIKPGQLNLMTAGRGMAHSEQSPSRHEPRIHGVQLWVALPERDRDAEPGVDHHAALPTAGLGAMELSVFMGSFAGVTSPARAYSEIVGVDINVLRDSDAELPLSPGFEYALLATLGAAEVEGARIEPGTMLYVSPGREAVTMRATAGSRLLLLGGLPFGEKILMWWNFVARTAEEIADAVDGWNQRRRFGDVDADDGERLAAPVPDVTKLRLR
jgi:redox-sensitive bicupin YhaK (pirin superfamily)